MPLMKWVEETVAKRLGAIPVVEKFAEHRAYRQFLRSVNDGEGLVVVRPDHPNVAVAALGREFKAILAHPLLKPFLRHPPELILVHSDSILPGIGKIKGALAYGRNIFIDSRTCDYLTAAEHRALLAHEVGHHVGLDLHPRNSFRLAFRRSMPLMEMRADEIAVAVTQDAAALDSGIQKLKALHPEIKFADHIAREGTYMQRLKLQADGGVYLPPEERSRFIHKVGDKVRDPKQRSHLEEVIRKRLSQEHARVFEHHR